MNTSKGVFTALMIVLSVLILELGSCTLLSVERRTVFTPAKFATERGAVLGSSAEPETAAHGEAADYRAKSRQAIHPFLGFVSDADTHEAAAVEGNSTQAAEHGFPRNSEDIFLPADDPRLVIAVLGGSVAGNISAFKPYFLHRALDREPLFAGRDMVVLSLANSGYKQPQQLMALNWFLALGAHFDMVVNLDGFNEVALPTAELIPNQVSPYFPRGWQLRVGDFDQTLRLDIAQLAAAREQRASWSAKFDTLPWRLSSTAATIWSLGDRSFARKVSDIEFRMLEHPSGQSFHVRGPAYDAAERSRVLDDLADVWRRSSEQMHALCEAHGILYFHFLQPNQYLEGSKPLSDEEKRNAWRENHPYRPGVVEGYPRLIEEGQELQRRGVRFFDLTQIFVQKKLTLYSDACCHFNFRGNMLLARNMAVEIAKDPQAISLANATPIGPTRHQ